MHTSHDYHVMAYYVLHDQYLFHLIVTCLIGCWSFHWWSYSSFWWLFSNYHGMFLCHFIIKLNHIWKCFYGLQGPIIDFDRVNMYTCIYFVLLHTCMSLRKAVRHFDVFSSLLSWAYICSFTSLYTVQFQFTNIH